MPAEIQIGRTYSIDGAPGFLFVPASAPGLGLFESDDDTEYVKGKLFYGCLAGYRRGSRIDNYTELASRLYPAPYNEMET